MGERKMAVYEADELSALLRQNDASGERAYDLTIVGRKTKQKNIEERSKS